MSPLFGSSNLGVACTTSWYVCVSNLGYLALSSNSIFFLSRPSATVMAVIRPFESGPSPSRSCRNDKLQSGRPRLSVPPYVTACCMHAGGSSAGLPLAGLPVIISVCLSLQKNSCMAFGDQRQGHAPRLCCLVAQVICCCWVDTASKAASYLKNCRSWSYNCITIYATTSLSDC